MHDSMRAAVDVGSAADHVGFGPPHPLDIVLATGDKDVRDGEV